jgi:hypothetical protein
LELQIYSENSAITTAITTGKAGSILEKPSAKYFPVFIEKACTAVLEFSHYSIASCFEIAGDISLQFISLVKYWLIVGWLSLHFSSDEWPSI